MLYNRIIKITDSKVFDKAITYDEFVELMKKCKEQKMGFCWYYPVISSEKPELPKGIEEDVRVIHLI